MTDLTAPILTERLELRPLSEEDLPFLVSLMSDAEVMRWVTGHARTPEETADWLAGDLDLNRRYGYGLRLAVDRRDGSPVGRGGVFPFVRKDGEVDGELAWMVRPERQGEGLGTEMARGALTWAVEVLRPRRIFARAHPDNVASIRIMERIGLSRAGDWDEDELWVWVPSDGSDA